MRILSYLRDKLVYIVSLIFSLIITYFILYAFNSNKMEIIYILLIILALFLIPLVYEYIKKNNFYNNFRKTLDNLDKKYLITEMVNNSNFLDGKLFLEYLYEIDKSMHEYINNYKNINDELKEYIELWCHEIKTPIATSKLIIDNNSNTVTKSILEELDSIENYVEQVLYYSKSDIVEKDYIVTNVDLKEVVDNVIKRNSKSLISKKIKIEINDLNKVNSDIKWLEFIINQIIINSIKYSKEDPIIKIYSKDNKNNIILTIEDNGIGIKESDITKVFDKGFTGSNGRKKYNSTGIGLYLVKKLCDKLEHNISIESELNKYTKVSITFPKSSMYL